MLHDVINHRAQTGRLSQPDAFWTCWKRPRREALRSTAAEPVLDPFQIETEPLSPTMSWVVLMPRSLALIIKSGQRRSRHWRLHCFHHWTSMLRKLPSFMRNSKISRRFIWLNSLYDGRKQYTNPMTSLRHRLWNTSIEFCLNNKIPRDKKAGRADDSNKWILG